MHLQWEVESPPVTARRGGRGTGRRTWWIAGIAALLVVALAAGAFVVQQRRDAEAKRDRAARGAAEAVAAGWQAGDLSGVHAFADPAAAQEQYKALTGGLGGVTPKVTVTGVERTDAEATADLHVTWPFGQGWAYDSRLRLTGDLDAPDGGRWTTELTPAVVQPDLADGDRLVAQRTAAPRAEVLGRDGTPIVKESPVVEVGVQPSRATDTAGLAKRLGDLLDVDAAGLAKRIEAASPDAFVPVITLRRPDYDAVRADLQPLPGTVFKEATLPLSPTREFARALLGTVGPATAELVENSKGRLAAGDLTGLSGLQRQYDERLAGTTGVTVWKVSKSGEEAKRTELFTVAPTAGQPVQLTIDVPVQEAADAALAGQPGNAALVAVDIRTGDVLAVANTPVSGANRALTGRYAPGSTFKTVSTIALLGTGLKPADTVSCPPTRTVEGRAFRNFEGGALGDVPFSTDFAQSCNTAFVGLSERLAPDDLSQAAASLGIGRSWTVGVDAFTGSVPAQDTPVKRAAATIGQSDVEVSPLAMAQAVAAIARGKWEPPRLMLDPAPADAKVETPAVDADQLATVRDLMRQVAERGTASALADVPGPPVYAKTGTAEFGNETPPQTRAWTVGFQGDVAFAVLVEEGASGGSVAVPVAEKFLRALQ
jgi:cell division protein FtsI/penicillin-binding protein 2